MVFPWLEVNRGTFHPFSDPDLLGAQGAVVPHAIPLIPSMRREVAAVWAACGEKAWGDGRSEMGDGFIIIWQSWPMIPFPGQWWLSIMMIPYRVSNGCFSFNARVLCMGSSLLTMIYKWETEWVKSARLAGEIGDGNMFEISQNMGSSDHQSSIGESSKISQKIGIIIIDHQMWNL